MTTVPEWSEKPYNRLTQRVMVVDDDPITATMLASSLKKEGYEVETYKDGESALKRLFEPNSPRLVLLDWVMPGMDGLEVVKVLRQKEVKPPHYVIMLTSKRDMTDIINALETGADDFIPKPFDPGELRARLNVGKRMISLNVDLLTQTEKANMLADYLASYDTTTGLPNRAYMKEKIQSCINERIPFILMLVNIDRFRRINQALGVERGDQLLKWFGKRLEEVFKEDNAAVGRVYADEFAVLVMNAHDPEVIHQEAERVKEAAKELPSDLAGYPFTLSIGVVYYSGKEADITSEDIANRVDIAVKKAKAKGGNHIEIHDEETEKEIQERFLIARELAQAIESNSLTCFLQPKVDRERRIRGAEALCRWIHPERGFISPGVFIPVAEETNLIPELDYWILRQVCQVLAKIDNPQISLSSNLSPRTFHNTDIVNMVKSILAETGANPERLILEVTEALVIEDVEEGITTMKELNSIGIRFSIDDFGTGYSSLKYLQRLPISEIKIDRGFLLDIPDNRSNMALVEAIIGIAQAMNLKIVAEGIETEEQARLLDEKADVLHQCFLFGKPMPIEEFLKLL